MRIIGGTLAGRRFGAPSGRGTRPTADRVREALASALQSRDAFEGATVLDAFAGTGALAFEALSRGATRAVLVDRDPHALRQLRSSAHELGLGGSTHVVRADLLRNPSAAVAKLPTLDDGFDLVFADAPYAEVEKVRPLLEALMKARLLGVGAHVVVERPAKYDWSWPNGLAPDAEYRYGHTGISLGVREPEKGIQ